MLWEIAAHSVGNLFSLYFVYLRFWLLPILVLRARFAIWFIQFLFIVFSLLFESRILLLITPVPVFESLICLLIAPAPFNCFLISFDTHSTRIRLTPIYILIHWPFQGATSGVALFACFGVSFCIVLPSMCLKYVKLD